MDHRRHPRDVIAEADVVIAGLFSAKRRDHVDLMDALEAEVTELGGIVAARFVQRRGPVVFYNELTERQRRALTAIFGCAVFSREDLREQ